MNKKLPIFIASVLAASSLTALTASPAYSADAPSRTTGQVIDDATITAAVKSKLLADHATQGLKINVTTKNGLVTLNGQVRSETERSLAGQMTADTTGVVSVQNQLTVQ